MPVKVSGGKGLAFTATLDISDALKKAQDLKKSISDLSVTANGISKGLESQKTATQAVTDALAAQTVARAKLTSADTTGVKPITEYQQKQLALKQTLIDSQAVSEELRQKNLQLQATYNQSKIEAQEYKNELEALKVSEQELKNQYQAGRVSLQEYTQQIEKNKIEQQALNAVLTQAAIDDKNAATALKEYNLQQKQLADAAKAARQAQVAASGSYDEASNRLKELGRSIKSAEGGFTSTNPAIQSQVKEYNKLNQSLKDFDDTMGNHQRHVGGYKQALDSAGNDLKSLALNYLSAYAALSALTTVIKSNSEISDSLADVRRTAGLTEDEVNRLVESLKKIDTRTSLKGLLDISIIGGQLGIAKDQLAGFTKAVDELSVTLAGEISGGADAVASSLGKINGVFKTQEREGTDVEKAFNKTGSAILALGQAGLATGEFLQDFGLRIAGVANTAKINLPTVLAYGAVLEETGSSAEVAGTSLARLIGNLAVKRDKFFSIARIGDATLTLKSFTDLINKDANAALQKFFQGLNAGGKDLTSFSELINDIGIRGGPAKNSIIALAQNQELLNDRIGESVKAYNDGTLAADQFALKNDNLASSISKLGNTFTNVTTSGRIGNFFKAIVDGLRDATGYFASLINSKGWAEFWDRLATVSQSGERSNDLKYNVQDASQAFFNSRDLLQFTKETSDPTQNKYIQGRAKQQIDENNASLKQLRDMYIQLDKSSKESPLSQDDTVIFNKIGRYIDKIKEQNSELSKFVVDAVKIKKLASDTLDTASEIPDNELKTVKEINDRILQLKNDALSVPANKADDIKRIQGLKATLRELAGLAKTNDAESLKENLNLIRQVDEATASFNRKTLTEDQAALTAVSDKFDQLRKRIAVFNADPKNKDHKIDNSVITKLNLNESNAIDSQADTNENKYIQQDIEKKKKLYADYESYKIKAGSTAADAEYADLLKSGKDFAIYLDNIKQSIDKTDTSGPIQERAELTQKQIDENVETQKKAYQELLDSTATYTQQRQAMIETAAADEKELNERGHSDQAAQVRRYLSDRLLALDEEQFKEMDAYRYLFDNIETISEKSAKKQIATLYGMAAAQLATGEISMAAYLKLIKQLDDANVKIKNKLPDELKAIGEGLSSISSEASNFSEELSKALGVAGSLVSSVGSIKSNIANLQDSSASSVSKISSGLGIIGTAIGVFSTIYSLFDNSKEKAEQLAYANDLQIKAIEAVNKALERQLELTKEIQGPERLEAYKKQLIDIAASQKSVQDQINKKYTLTGDKATDGIIAAGPDNPLFGQVIYNATRAGASVSLVGKSIEDLQKLMDEGKLDTKTIALVQSLIDLQQQAKDTANALNEDITGINFDSLKDSIKDVFASGKTDAQSFADAIEKSIRGAFANAFERNEIDKALQPFYDELAKDGADGIFTPEEIQQLRDMKTSISNGLAAKAKVYQDIIGPDPTDPNSSAPSTLTADVKSITEDTGSIIAGTMHGIQLSNIQIKDLLTVQGKTIGDMYQVAQGNFAYLVKIEANTYRTANNTDLLIPTLLRIENKLGSGSSALAGNGRTG